MLEKVRKEMVSIIFAANFQQINSYLLRACNTKTAMPGNCRALYGFLNLSWIQKLSLFFFSHNNLLMVGWTTTSISILLMRTLQSKVKRSQVFWFGPPSIVSQGQSAQLTIQKAQRGSLLLITFMQHLPSLGSVDAQYMFTEEPFWFWN